MDTNYYITIFSQNMEQTVGQQLTALREAKGMTQDELASKSGVSRPQISRLENDEVDVPRRSTLAKLTNALGVPSTTLASPLMEGRVLSSTSANAEAENLAQFENVVLHEEIAEQNEKINNQAEQIMKLKAMVAYLNSELGKFGGSLEAALHGLVPTSPRVGALVAA